MALPLNSVAWNSRMEGRVLFSMADHALSSSRRWSFHAEVSSSFAKGLPSVPGMPARKRATSLASRERGVGMVYRSGSVAATVWVALFTSRPQEMEIAAANRQPPRTTTDLLIGTSFLSQYQSCEKRERTNFNLARE